MSNRQRKEELNSLKERLQPNLSKLTKIAKRNTKYNKQGYAILSSDEE